MPIQTYGIQLLGAAEKSNIYNIQTFQFITLHKTLNTLYYISNQTLHTDTKINTAEQTEKVLHKRFRSRL